MSTFPELFEAEVRRDPDAVAVVCADERLTYGELDVRADRLAGALAARGATLRTHLINVPARLAQPQRRPVLHLPAHWPRAQAWLTLWRAVFIN